MTVLKLAAMLRVADGLDRSHQQRVASFKLEVTEGDLLVDCTHNGDISVERYGMAMKAQMFEEVFGYHVVIT